MTTPRKVYLGDGAYVEMGQGELILTTENGIETTNRIVLESDTWQNLTAFVAMWQQQLRIASATQA